MKTVLDLVISLNKLLKVSNAQISVSFDDTNYRYNVIVSWSKDGFKPSEHISINSDRNGRVKSNDLTKEIYNRVKRNRVIL